MACRGENHEGPVSESTASGTDRQGNWWKTVRYTCQSCGKSWTDTFGPGA